MQQRIILIIGVVCIVPGRYLSFGPIRVPKMNRPINVMACLCAKSDKELMTLLSCSTDFHFSVLPHFMITYTVQFFA